MTEIVSYYPLASKVLAVLVQRIDGWCVYVDTVPGYDHDQEKQEVADHGNKISEQIAKAIFPHWGQVTEGEYAL